jgi:hypothetical protein
VPGVKARGVGSIARVAHEPGARDGAGTLAAAACQRIAERVVEALKRQPATLSSDDSGLLTVWEELCVHVQDEESFFWDAYVETASQFIRAELDGLSRRELEAVWLQTRAGFEWFWDFSHYLLPRAEEFSSAEIDAFLERAQSGRHELDRDLQDEN